MNLKETITNTIQTYVSKYQERIAGACEWGAPLVGFADANHPELFKLRELISQNHIMPHQVIEKPTIIIAYFIPFTRELANTNQVIHEAASPEWAYAYEETNKMLGELNRYLISDIKQRGYNAAVSKAAATFDREKLISNWSHRHIARLAGLGTFGINNMLITKQGCCGRYSTLVTNLDIVPDKPLDEEYCLYKKQGACGICVKKCPSGALTLSGYDRKKCYQVCLKNAELYKNLGNSYLDESAQHSNDTGSEICGKCVVNVPCSFK
ncbi:MAG: epoxyqueuosine reductase [Sporomusaceae bacterium]|nr:epoxyqueuosine reductase [Sporomusaceae bacterium]